MRDQPFRLKIPVLSFGAGFGSSLPAIALVLGALLLYAMTSASLYDLRFLTLVCIYAIMVLGFQVIFGHLGAVSLAQSTFFGLGAYVTGIVGVSFGLDTLLLLPLSILASVLLASLIAIPVLKLDDHYFSLATLGIALVVQLVAINWETLTGGLNGFAGIPGIIVAGISLETRPHTFLFVWVCLVVAILVSLRALNSLYGLSFNLARESPHAASSLGIDVGRLRLTGLLLSAGFAGAAGALMAHVLRVVSPENLDLSLMATCLIITVVGGSTRPLGAILGALLIIFLRERFRVAQNFSLMAYTAATLAILILAPYGIVGSLERLLARFERKPPQPAAPSQADEPSRVSLAAPTAAAPLLTVRDAAKQFGGVSALDGVDLDIRAGEIVGLIGPNGSGKTTLINVISGLYTADRGAIDFDGAAIAKWPAHAISAHGMARTFQHIDLVDDLSARDNIAIGAFRPQGASLVRAFGGLGADPCLREARERALALARFVGIEAVAQRRCGELPYGTRRRVEIARALAAGPKLLLLDEPAAGLNASEQADLAQRIKTVVATGVTVLVIEHNLLFLGAVAQRLICLDRGRIIAHGTPDEVRRHPDVIAAYLGEAA